ncbi:hypothetical protein DMA11_15910 [Marinilabiliaceae bacterium JC017]|nr:hypothetical protein DMA11_15910 [Marinilabiliaceae bacterium JC017]
MFLGKRDDGVFSARDCNGNPGAWFGEGVGKARSWNGKPGHEPQANGDAKYRCSMFDFRIKNLGWRLELEKTG